MGQDGNYDMDMWVPSLWVNDSNDKDDGVCVWDLIFNIYIIKTLNSLCQTGSIVNLSKGTISRVSPESYRYLPFLHHSAAHTSPWNLPQRISLPLPFWLHLFWVVVHLVRCSVLFWNFKSSYISSNCWSSWQWDTHNLIQLKAWLIYGHRKRQSPLGTIVLKDNDLDWKRIHRNFGSELSYFYSGTGNNYLKLPSSFSYDYSSYHFSLFSSLFYLLALSYFTANIREL